MLVCIYVYIIYPTFVAPWFPRDVHALKCFMHFIWVTFLDYIILYIIRLYTTLLLDYILHLHVHVNVDRLLFKVD